MFTLLNVQSLLGPLLVMGLCWLVSEDRRLFPWKLVAGSLLFQVMLVLLFFAVPASRDVLAAAGYVVAGLAAATKAGTQFVFGYLAGGEQPFVANSPGLVFLFAFQVLPVILVICALSAMLWHLGILKWIATGFGLLFQQTLGLRGPPALAVAATVFMGQVEGPIFIRAYLEKLSRSELFMLLTVGMSCISGSTLVAYVTILSGTLNNAAAHVLTASLVSAPAGVLLARIIVPKGDDEADGHAGFVGARTYESTIDAVAHGISDGLQVVLNVGATLIVFVAFVAMADALLAAFPPILGMKISVEGVLGLIFSPLAWSIGISYPDVVVAGRLLGVKMVLTEFSAFIQLGQLDHSVLSDRSRMLLTYALCGFANIGSVGINVSGFSVLVPSRRQEVLSLVWKALMAGFLATCMTASIIGALPASLFGP